MREKRQEEAVEAFLKCDKRSILNCCPRFGKVKCAIDIMKKGRIEDLLLMAPRNDIFKGWYDDFEKFGYRPHFIKESTFTSIKKLKDIDHQLIIIDEPHEMSINQQKELSKKLKDYKGWILGLTGTMTQKTREELYNNLNLDVCYKYTISQGVEEGILSDYEIFVHQVPLDDKRYTFSTKSQKYTEQGYFNLYEYIKKQAKDSQTRHHMDLKLINIIQNSVSKMEKTRKLIAESKGERLLVFCGVTDVADKIGLPVYHSKAKEKEVLDDFCMGKGNINQLVTIKMMQAGITINPINKGIINYLSGNSEDGAQKICRFLGFEYANPEKKAEIHIVCTNEEFEKLRLKTALLFFDEDKIQYL